MVQLTVGTNLLGNFIRPVFVHVNEHKLASNRARAMNFALGVGGGGKVNAITAEILVVCKVIIQNQSRNAKHHLSVGNHNSRSNS